MGQTGSAPGSSQDHPGADGADDIPQDLYERTSTVPMQHTMAGQDQWGQETSTSRSDAETNFCHPPPPSATTMISHSARCCRGCDLRRDPQRVSPLYSSASYDLSQSSSHFTRLRQVPQGGSKVASGQERRLRGGVEALRQDTSSV